MSDDDLHDLACRMGCPDRPHLSDGECRQVLAIVTELRDLRARVAELESFRKRARTIPGVIRGQSLIDRGALVRVVDQIALDAEIAQRILDGVGKEVRL